MLTLAIYFNRIKIQHNGVNVDYRGTFSNSRMIVADFEALLQAIQAILQQAVAQKIYTPPSKLLGNIRATPLCLDVREHLADGLSPIEYKALLESIMAIGNSRNVKPERILYQGKRPFQAA